MTLTAGPIVVGVDGSSSSEQALAWAATRAEAENRVLALAHAVPPTTPVLLDPAGRDPQEARDLSLREKAQQVLATAREQVLRLAPDVTVEELCLIGDPREELVELSSTASTVVLGSRGRGPVKSLLLGSTAVAVVRHARCPVIVHRPTKPAAQRHGIAVGADATEDSLPVLEFAFREASIRHLPLTVVHSFWYFEPPPTALEDDASTMSQRRRALSMSLAGFGERYPDVSVYTEIDQGMPERFLLRIASDMEMLIVGAHHGTRAEQFMFGSVSVWLVEHADCTVGVVPLSID